MSKLLKKLAAIALSFSLFLPCSAHLLEDDTIFIVGSTSMAKLIDITSPHFYQQKQTKVVVRPIGSDKGVVAVAEGVSNLGIISRYLTPDEMKRWPHIQQITIGQDAIILMVNIENSIERVSKEELANLYTGKHRFWENNAPVALMAKHLGHGTHSAFINYLAIESMAKDEQHVVFKPQGINTLFSNIEAKSYHQINQAVASVFRNKDAIAFDSLGAYQQFIKNQPYAQIKLLNVEGQLPIINGKVNKDYGFKRPLNILVNKHFYSQTAAYIDFLLSEQGQKIIADNYFIPIN
ncbi:substrate-binding domain-containing protein [Thalassotalea sp. PLHSN55]|uniref:substrate-binding domain-containing protein n=1 Tax=Thalassotalea sp. PLHSN55 TaxID=3435888 RepID=UPI003F83E8B4